MSRVARGGGDDDGLVQRFQLAVWPEIDKAWTDEDRSPDLEARKRAYAVFERLDNIDVSSVDAEGSEAKSDPPFLRFGNKAQEMFTEWRTELERRIRSGDEQSMLEAHLAKYRSLVPTLALLIHLADVGAGPVSEDALTRACAWAEYLESHARRLYSPAISPSRAATWALAERILKGDLGSSFALRDVYRNEWRGLGSRDEAVLAVDRLEALDWLQVIEEKTPGRPRTRCVVNPQLRKEEGRGEVA